MYYFLSIFLLLVDLQSSLTLTGDPLLSNLRDEYFLKSSEECSKILDDFAEISSNFTLCSIRNARPVRLCNKCVDYYIGFHSKYNELLNTVVNGTSCLSIFISHDRLEVVLAFHDNILTVWNKGNCNACFDWSGTGPTISNNTLNFNKLFNETKNCIVNNLKDNNTEEVCQACMHSYLKLDNFYQTLSTDAIGVDSICMDIVDSMNSTRSIWSKTLKCCQLRRTPEVIFLCCSGIISLLPLIYYLVVRYCGPIRELPNILKQSRFKQTFLRSNHIRIN